MVCGVELSLHAAVAAAGISWLLIGILVYVTYRHRQGLDLTTTKKIVVAGPAVHHAGCTDKIVYAQLITM